MLDTISALGSSVSPWQILALVVAYLLALCLAMSMHEFSHAFVATKMGDPTPRLQGRLTLNPFAHISGLGLLTFLIFRFGWAKPVEVNPLRFKNYRKGMTLVSISGVITNLILAFIFSGLTFFFVLFLDATNVFFFFLQYFALFGFTINTVLAVFNFLPIAPLDGYNLIKSLSKPGNAFVRFMEKYGFIILLVFLISPIFDLFYSYVIIGLENIFMDFGDYLYNGRKHSRNYV